MRRQGRVSAWPTRADMIVHSFITQAELYIWLVNCNTPRDKLYIWSDMWNFLIRSYVQKYKVIQIQSVYCSEVVPLELAHADITAVTATVTTIIFSLSMRIKMRMRFGTVLQLFSPNYKCQSIFFHRGKESQKHNTSLCYIKWSRTIYKDVNYIQHNPAVKWIQSLVSTDQYDRQSTHKFKIQSYTQLCCLDNNCFLLESHCWNWCTVVHLSLDGGGDLLSTGDCPFPN